MNRSALFLLIVAGVLGGTAGLQARSNVPGQVTLFKTASYLQKSATEIVPVDGRPYTFEAAGRRLLLLGSFTDAEDEGSFVVVVPNSGKANAPFDSSLGEYFFSMSYMNQSAFNLCYPFGTYTARIQLPGASAATSMTLPIKAHKFPVIPKLKNFAAAQAVDVTKEFTLKWSAFSDAGDKDVILVRLIRPDGSVASLLIGEDMFGAPLFPGTTSLAIRANFLEPGTTYMAEITFVHVDLRFVSQSGTDFSRGSGVTTKLRVPLRTLPGPG